jgi:hypothetical protein
MLLRPKSSHVQRNRKRETIMAGTKTNHRSIVSLHLPLSVPALITYARSIVTAMTGNSAFPAPVPALATVTAEIDALEVAEKSALARTKGAVLARNEQKTALIGLLQQLKAYIQAEADANVENGASIISSAGVAVRKVPVRKPRVFEAKPGPVSGSVVVVTHSAGHRASYEWQYSTDGGKTWVSLPATPQAKTSVSGLTALTTVEFRYLTVTKTGQSDWSAPISFIVK